MERQTLSGIFSVQVRAEQILSQCRAHWRELLFAVAVLLITSMAVITGLYLGRPGWHVNNDTMERIVVSADDALTAEGHGNLASNDFTAHGKGGDSYYVVEDLLTGQTIKRSHQARDANFKRWTRYKVLETYEMSGRLVAGLKESKSILIRIQPKGLQVPNVDQLREIAESLRSSEHHSTYVYYYLPGMDVKQSPWSTVFQQSNRPTSVSFDKTYVPELYRRFEDQVWK